MCGALSESGRTCANCRRKTSLDGLVVVAYFDRGPIREMVHALKYQNTKEIADILGQLGIYGLDRIYHKKFNDLVVVPVPLHPKRLAKRGYNQVEILIRGMNMPVNSVLKRVKDTISQTGLSRIKRQENVSGAFICTQQVEGEILLVDDVATTGATLDECARVLKSAGARRVYGLVVARG